MPFIPAKALLNRLVAQFVIKNSKADGRGMGKTIPIVLIDVADPFMSSTCLRRAPDPRPGEQIFSSP
jgi:hypothetical protein